MKPVKTCQKLGALTTAIGAAWLNLPVYIGAKLVGAGAGLIYGLANSREVYRQTKELGRSPELLRLAKYKPVTIFKQIDDGTVFTRKKRFKNKLPAMTEKQRAVYEKSCAAYDQLRNKEAAAKEGKQLPQQASTVTEQQAPSRPSMAEIFKERYQELRLVM